MEFVQVYAMSWAEIEAILDQLTRMQTENTYTYHYPDKQPDEVYVRSKLLELKGHLCTGNTLFAGAMRDGVLLGYIWCYTSNFIDQKRLIINALYVLSESRGTGLAQALMSFAEEWAQTQSCTELATHYAVHNEHAGGFYSKQGFLPTRMEMVKKIK